MLERQRSQVGVGHEVAGRAEWFQQPADEGQVPPRRLDRHDERAGRPRLDDAQMHAEHADRILDEVVAGGGRRIDERFRPSWTVVADADGNRVCICTNHGRD